MRTVYSHKYPAIQGSNIKLYLGPWDIPAGIEGGIKTPYEKVFLSEIDPGEIPKEKFSDAPQAKIYRAFAIKIPGSFYKHSEEDLHTIGVIACEAEQMVLLTDMFSVPAQERLFVVYAVIYEQMVPIMRQHRENNTSQAEERFLALQEAD